MKLIIEALTGFRDANLRHMTRLWPSGATLTLASIALLSFAHQVTAAGDACDARYQFAFVDGAKSCLVDTPFADENLVGWHSSVRQLAPRGGLYSIAASPHDGQCPKVVAMTFVKPGAPGTYGGDTGAPARTETARLDCQQKVDAAKAPGSECNCVVAVVNGQSSLSRTQFELLFPRPHP